MEMQVIKQRSVLAYLDGLSERVNQLPVPAFVAGAAAAGRVTCGIGCAAAVRAG